MACILENLDKLELGCTLDCFHKNGKLYSSGKWPNRDPEVPRNTEPPPYVRFTFKLKVDDESLYESIGRWLGQFKDDQIDVKSFGSHRISNDIKDEYKEPYELDLQDYERRVARLHELINEIKALNLGNMLTELKMSTNGYDAPEEWFNKTYINSSYTVCCHHKTQFYKWLKEAGFLEQYVPASWYE